MLSPIPIGEKPKHVLQCMTLQHLFRSAELTNLINKFGHLENYSFSLELESALAMVLQESSKILSLHIIKNPSVASVFHSDLDNFIPKICYSRNHSISLVQAVWLEISPSAQVQFLTV